MIPVRLLVAIGSPWIVGVLGRSGGKSSKRWPQGGKRGRSAVRWLRPNTRPMNRTQPPARRQCDRLHAARSTACGKWG